MSSCQVRCCWLWEWDCRAVAHIACALLHLWRPQRGRCLASPVQLDLEVRVNSVTSWQGYLRASCSSCCAVALLLLLFGGTAGN
jgi:hypothetical protein